ANASDQTHDGTADDLAAGVTDARGGDDRGADGGIDVAREPGGVDRPESGRERRPPSTDERNPEVRRECETDAAGDDQRLRGEKKTRRASMRARIAASSHELHDGDAEQHAAGVDDREPRHRIAAEEGGEPDVVQQVRFPKSVIALARGAE